MRLDRITLKTMRGNARSQRVAERAGFHLLPGQADEDTGVEYIWFELRGSGDALWKLLYS
jgi:RimJ/RimL family protein N-acetyltransferase